MACLRLEEIIQAARGRLLAGSAEGVVPSVSIDSRTLKAGDLFFALRGPHFDGHDFVVDALRRRAGGAVVSEARRDFQVLSGGALILVRDTTRALQDIAHYVRTRWAGSVVAVTGSAGKTTTKDMIAKVLEGAGRVLKSQGNLNNHYGLPLTLYQLETFHDVAVVEMGMNHAGEIARLCEIAAPNVGVFTNVAPVHLENFPSLEGIAAAKAELAHYLDPAGAVIYNFDDPLVRRIGQDFHGAKLSYGMDAAAGVRAEAIVTDSLVETRFTVWYQGRPIAMRMPMLGKHNVYNALAAVATGLYFQIDPMRIAEQLAGLAPSAMRGEILQFAEGFTLIDDSYNSNPKALRAMVQTLREINGFQRRIVAAGSMLELGPQSAALHRECGQFIAEAGVDWLLCVGAEAPSLAEGARAGGLPPAAVRCFSDAVAAGDFLCTLIGSGDLLLVKGSRGIRMDRLVSRVKETFKLRGI